MKFLIDRDALLSAMSRVAGIVSKRGVIQILQNVLLDVTNEKKVGPRLTIRATDLDIEATVTVILNKVEATGRITAPAAQLLDIAKSLPEGAEIKAELVDGRLNVGGGRSRWKLSTLDALTFPVFAPGEWEWSHTISGAHLADTISRVSWAASTDAGKQFLCGVRVIVHGGELWAVATQSKDMAWARMDCEGAADFGGVTLSNRTCQEIVRFCTDRTDLTLKVSANMVMVQAEESSLWSKVVDLEYAAWQRMMDIERDGTFTVGRTLMTAALRRAAIGADVDKDGHYLRLELSAGALSVTGRSATTDALDEVEVGYEGEPVRIGINSEAVLNCLGVLTRDDVTVRFDPNRPAPISYQCDGDDGIICLSMPLKAGAA